MSIQDTEDLKQHYLDEMKSLINDLQIKDYCNERIDTQYRRECEIKIYELKQNFNGMSIEIRKKEKELLLQEQAAYVRTSQRFCGISYIITRGRFLDRASLYREKHLGEKF
ncbi:hypothetical protein Tco_1479411 [Tanacetum coccineum]